MSEEVIESAAVEAAAPAPVAPAPAAAAPVASEAPTAAPEASPEVKAPKWPDDWRDQLASGDEKLAGLAKRYNSPADVLKALRAAQVKISSGEVKAPLPKDATPEQVAEWRKENGIPESADKYEIKLDDGLVIGDDIKPVIEGFKEQMHGLNAPPALVEAAVKYQLKANREAAEKRAELDVSQKTELEDSLRVEWGNDYRPNINGVVSMLKSAGSDVADGIMQARMPDGTALFNHPSVVKWMAEHARMLGFVGSTVVPSGSDVGATVDGEIKAIEASMYSEDGSRNPAYWGDAKVQARYSQLLAARKRMK